MFLLNLKLNIVEKIQYIKEHKHGWLVIAIGCMFLVDIALSMNAFYWHKVCVYRDETNHVLEPYLQGQKIIKINNNGIINQFMKKRTDIIGELQVKAGTSGVTIQKIDVINNKNEDLKIEIFCTFRELLTFLNELERTIPPLIIQIESIQEADGLIKSVILLQTPKF